MPTKRTRRTRPLAQKVTARAVDAWRRGDWGDLHAALGLRPWQPSPVNVDPRHPPEDRHHRADWQLALDFRHELEQIAGKPGRR